MKSLKIAILSILLALPVVLFSTPAHAASDKCTDTVRSIDTLQTDTDYILVRIRYKVCENRKTKRLYAKLRSGMYHYEVPPVAACGPSGFRGFSYKTYFQDNAGRNYNFPKVTIPCSSDGVATATQRMRGRLLYEDGPPRWHTNVTKKLDFGIPDINYTLRGALNLVPLPVSNFRSGPVLVPTS